MLATAPAHAASAPRVLSGRWADRRSRLRKLTQADADAIRIWAARHPELNQHAAAIELAPRYGVSVRTIAAILRCETWASTEACSFTSEDLRQAIGGILTPVVPSPGPAVVPCPDNTPRLRVNADQQIALIEAELGHPIHAQRCA